VRYVGVFQRQYCTGYRKQCLSRGTFWNSCLIDVVADIEVVDISRNQRPILVPKLGIGPNAADWFKYALPEFVASYPGWCHWTDAGNFDAASFHAVLGQG
jgi:hypothetical protein